MCPPRTHKLDDIVELLKEKLTEEGLVRYFLWNGEEYNVVNTPCTIEDCKSLLEAILRQAVNDFIKLSVKPPKNDYYREALKTATGLLFTDDYHIEYGGMCITVRDIIYFLTGNEPNMDMFRKGVKRMVSVELAKLNS